MRDIPRLHLYPVRRQVHLPREVEVRAEVEPEAVIDTGGISSEDVRVPWQGQTLSEL